MTIEQAIDDLMDASRSIAEVAESESDEANRINAQNVADDCKQLAAWLRELQERREEQYLTIEQIAAKVGPQTIHSARLWFEFARVLDFLGYAVVKRRTDENNNLHI